MPQTIWIARHANRLDFVHPEWFNTAERKYDPPLSKDGFIQAQELAKKLKSKSDTITHIFCSPFLRTIQTANEIAKILDLPIKLEAGLSEWLNPDWMSETPETKPYEELVNEFPCIDGNYKSQVIPKYPENDKTVSDRTQKTVKILLEQFKEDILLVTHKVSILAATQYLVGKDEIIDTSLASLIQIKFNHNQWEIV